MHKSTVQTDSHPEDVGNADKACNGQVYSTHMDIVVTEASHYNILKIFHQGHICSSWQWCARIELTKASSTEPGCFNVSAHPDG